MKKAIILVEFLRRKLLEIRFRQGLFLFYSLSLTGIHGMGEQAAGYSNEFEEMLRTQFEKIKLNDDQLIFKEIVWSSILSTNEGKLFHNIKENLSFLGLRKFIIHSFGDAITYQKTGSPHDTYNLINDLIKTKYDELVKAGKLIDIEVNSGTILTPWNPLYHLDYWTDKDVIKLIAKEVR